MTWRWWRFFVQIFLSPSLSIQVCPKISGLTLQSYCGDGIGTIKPTIFREVSGFLGPSSIGEIEVDAKREIEVDEKFLSGPTFLKGLHSGNLT